MRVLRYGILGVFAICVFANALTLEAPVPYEGEKPEVEVHGEFRFRYETQSGSKQLKRPQKGSEASISVGVKP